MTDAIELDIDPDELTLGDLDDFEQVCGKPIQEILKPVPVKDEDGNKTFDERGRPVTEVNVPTKALIALVWITQRVKRPDFTMDDARKVRVSALRLHESDVPEPVEDPKDETV